jgi:hypothetical protein
MNALTTTDAAPFVPGTGLVPRNMDEALRLAEFMARARTVPKHLQDSPGDCLMVIEQAMRWGMSPFAVAQATSVISGKMMHEGKLVAAAVETSGAIVGHIDYSFTGEGDARAVTVSATRRGETNPRTVSVTFREARTNNEMWKRQPDQQLVYHGARVWARRWTPAVILGVYSREEMGPTIEGEIASDEPIAPIRTARDALNDTIPLRSAAAATPRAPRKADTEVYEADPAQNRFYRQKPADETEPRETDEERWKRNLLAKLALARSRADVVAVGGLKSVHAAQNSGIPELSMWVTYALNHAFDRFPADETEAVDDDLDEVVIKGEEHLAAG